MEPSDVPGDDAEIGACWLFLDAGFLTGFGEVLPGLTWSCVEGAFVFGVVFRRGVGEGVCLGVFTFSSTVWSSVPSVVFCCTSFKATAAFFFRSSGRIFMSSVTLFISDQMWLICAMMAATALAIFVSGWLVGGVGGCCILTGVVACVTVVSTGKSVARL